MASAHTRYVCRLYKQALNTAYDWFPNRLLSRPIMLQIRARFEANKHETNPVRLQKILRETEDELNKYKHPLPYTYMTAPGGTKYERNLWWEQNMQH